MSSSIEQTIRNMTLEEKIRLCMGDGLWRTARFPERGIESILMSDGTSGVRFQKGSDILRAADFIESISGSFDSAEAVRNTNEATCFPSGSTIACSWDRALVRRIGNAIAGECRALGIDLLLGPGINIRRHPLTARNFEYYSEDPRLAGDMACAMVEGVQERGVGTSVKHFACHNSDTRRTRVDAIVDERALREIYLAPFERVVRLSRPATVMTAYNKINGVQATESPWLLGTVLRGEWGFEGATISDWGAVKDVVAATAAGLDLQMPLSPSSALRLAQAVNDGGLPMEAVDRRVRNIIALRKRLSELADAAPAADAVVDFQANHALAARAAAESMVLLKNEGNLLPLEGGPGIGRVAVIGRLAKEPLYQGTGCAIVHAREVDSPWECLIAGKPEGLELRYAEGYRRDNSTDAALLDEAAGIASGADVAVVFVGSFLPEESDRYNRTDMRIEAAHERLIGAVSRAAERVVVVLAAGDSVVMPWIGGVSSVLVTGFAGEASGSAVADVLYGSRCPSGKLSATIPVRLQDTPAYLSFPGDEFNLRYDESFYVGYRYYDKKEVEPLFPFGFGLSYTTFSYANLRLSAESVGMPDGLSVFVDVTNTGSRAGKEIAQLYIAQRAPRLPRPVRELKGFEKVELSPGETKKVEFKLEERDFAYYDPAAARWIVDTDIFDIEIGASSRDIRLSLPVSVKAPAAPPRRLDIDSGFLELFENEKAKSMLFDFLAESGLLDRDRIDGRLERTLETSFWGLFSYLDMHSSGKVTYEMLRDLMDRIGKAMEEHR